MSSWENSLYSYIEGRLIPLERVGKIYYFRNNSFSGKIKRYDGSQGFIKNNKKGTPDIIICYKGHFIGIELKTMTGRQSPDQKLAEQDIISAGGKYFIIKTPEEFENILSNIV